MQIINIQVRADDATVLNEVLDIEENAFEDAMSRESDEPHENWEQLLELTGSYSDTIAVIKRVKEAIESGRPT